LDQAVGPRGATERHNRLADQGFGLDLDLPTRIEQRRHDDHGRRGPDLPKNLAVGIADCVCIRRVRTTSVIEAPASVSAASMISRQRRVCTAASSGQLPSGHTGAVPDTSTLLSTRTARLNPIRGSNGEPEDTRCLMARR
jgi:hypothetical protein